jgi:hypothetical protein
MRAGLARPARCVHHSRLEQQLPELHQGVDGHVRRRSDSRGRTRDLVQHPFRHRDRSGLGLGDRNAANYAVSTTSLYDDLATLKRMPRVPHDARVSPERIVTCG